MIPRKTLIPVVFLLAGILPALGADCPVDVPGDLNGDCKVNQLDLAILSANWLRDGGLPASLAVLKILDVGITPDQAGKLAEQLKIPRESLALERGEAVFVDPVNLMRVPTKPVTDEGLIKQLIEASEVPRGGELGFESLDRNTLAKIQPVPTQDAIIAILIGLRNAGIELGEGATFGDGSVFELRNLEGGLLLPAVQLDTRVGFEPSFGGIPVLGPGAQFSVRLGPDGQATQLHIAKRSLGAGEEIPLLSPQTAGLRAFAASGGNFVPEGTAKLVYFAPSLEHQNAKFLVPHYDLGGVVYGAEGQQANKLRKLVPAVDDPKFVPQLILRASVKGSLVRADALVNGGTPPYRFRWFSSSADLRMCMKSSIIRV